MCLTSLVRKLQVNLFLKELTMHDIYKNLETYTIAIRSMNDSQFPWRTGDRLTPMQDSTESKQAMKPSLAAHYDTLLLRCDLCGLFFLLFHIDFSNKIQHQLVLASLHFHFSKGTLFLRLRKRLTE